MPALSADELEYRAREHVAYEVRSLVGQAFHEDLLRPIGGGRRVTTRCSRRA